MTKLTNPLKSAICNRTERFSRMRRQNAPMFVQGVLFLVMHCVLFDICVFGLAENNVSVIVRFGLCCVECYLFVCYVVGFVCLVRCVASCEC